MAVGFSRWAAAITGLLGAVALVAPVTASAHPLGNFTVNRYSEIELSGDRVYISYVLDMAEIPTFQERTKIDALGKAVYARRLVDRIRRGLALTLDGKPVPLETLGHELGFPPGVAGLRTMRLEIVYGSPGIEESDRPLELRYRDANFANRAGWKEITLHSSAGAELLTASVPEDTISEELKAYPQNLLQSPLDVTEARARYDPGSTAGPVPPLPSAKEVVERVSVRSSSDGGFASLIARDDLGAAVVLVSLLVAVFWGAAHALSPGHGKAIVAAYLVGSRGTGRHALYLGVIVTVTHTIGVFALGLVTLALSEFIVPEQLYPWLNLVSALLVVAVGTTVLRWRLREWRTARRGSHPGHWHEHSHAEKQTHEHEHPGHHRHRDHDHSHVPEPGSGMRGLVSMGISGGIIPCPTALVVLLAAISLHRVGYGLILILAFSVGLAAAMTGIGLLAISAKRLFSRIDFEGRAIRLLPAISALVIVGFGIAMTVRAVSPLT